MKMPSAFLEKIKSAKDAGYVYVIAELGSNWKTESDLINAVNMAKQCGADAIKFQFFTESELYGPKPELNKTFPLSNLKLKCDAAKIDMLCSAFSPEGVREVDKFVDAHKIASSEMSHIRMLEAAKATGKPIILSTGGYYVPDIQRVLKFLGDYPVVLMHCNLSYPANLVDLKKFKDIKRLGIELLGYSDHTTSIDAVPSLMKLQGVSVYEKHFNPFDYKDTPDAFHSLGRDNFTTFVSYLRNEPKDATEENEGRLKYIRRIIAISDIKIGDKLLENVNIGIFRSRLADANGVNPFFIDRIANKTAARSIKAGEGISVADAL
jgi:sialic acid synthase SpsE